MDPRIRNALALYTFGALGVFLLIAPWTAVWEHATLSVVPREAQSWVRSGWLRGLVSGVGALDLAVAVQAGAELWRRIRLGDGSRGTTTRR